MPATIRRVRKRKPPWFVRAALLLATAAISAPSFADLFTSQTAYQKGDFDTAFKGFRELAELGQPKAQYNLAIMYARGEGTRESDINAYAWAEIAGDNGNPQGKLLADKVRPYLAPGSESLAEDIRARFGPPALTERLMPKALASADDELMRTRCKPVANAFPTYPLQALDEGVQGEVFVAFTLMPDGHARNPRILYAIPRKAFEQTVRSRIMSSGFGVAPAGSAPLQCTLFYRFVIEGKGLSDYDSLKAFMVKIRKRAEEGDPGAQLVYGMAISGLPQLSRPRSEALPWFLKAAQAGSPAAQFQVGYSLLNGLGCRCEESKALVWLARAAASDEPDAQVALGAYALRDRSDPDALKRAKVWLERAVAQDSHDGTLYLSALLSTAPDAQLRDPKRGLDLIDKMFAGIKEDPTAFEIRAAAQAALARFPEAVNNEQTAINMARKIGWDVSALNERLSSYQGNQPWYGDLLGF